MENTDKTAVVYFSITGHSERLARRLARILNGKLIPLKAPAYRPGAIGYLRAGFDSLRQKCVLGPQEFTSLEGFERLVLCGPVWTSYPAVPLRALLQSGKTLPASVSLFLTSGDRRPAEKAWAVAAKDLRRPLAAKASMANAFEGTEQADQILRTFIHDLGAVSETNLRSIK